MVVYAVQRRTCNRQRVPANKDAPIKLRGPGCMERTDVFPEIEMTRGSIAIQCNRTVSS